MGYLHDDIGLECPQCGKSWTLGVPVGEFDGGEDLICDSCGVFMWVHRVVTQPDHKPYDLEVHLKCGSCYNFKKITRTGKDNVTLIGYPHITGSTADAEPFGWTDDGR